VGNNPVLNTNNVVYYRKSKNKDLYLKTRCSNKEHFARDKTHLHNRNTHFKWVCRRRQLGKRLLVFKGTQTLHLLIESVGRQRRQPGKNVCWSSMGPKHFRTFLSRTRLIPTEREDPVRQDVCAAAVFLRNENHRRFISSMKDHQVLKHKASNACNIPRENSRMSKTTLSQPRNNTNKFILNSVVNTIPSFKGLGAKAIWFRCDDN